MALCCMPSSHIRPLFFHLAQAAESEPFQKLIKYVRDSWIESSTFVPETWSVFGLPFRTNNDVEGWHHRLIRKAKPQTPFYLLIQVLYEKASDISLNVELLSNKKLQRRLRKKYVELNKKIFKLWKRYSRGDISTKKLLKACSCLDSVFE